MTVGELSFCREPGGSTARERGLVVEQEWSRRLAEMLPLLRGNSVSDAISVAIAVEHSFGIVLADDELTPERLCDAQSLTATVSRHLAVQ